MPTSLNTRIYDKIQKHSIDIVRVEAGLERQVTKFYKNMTRELSADIARIQPSDPARLTFRRKRLKKLEAAAKETITGELKGASTIYQSELRGLASFEQHWARDMLNTQIGVDLVSIVPTNAMIRELVSSVMIEGAPSKEWWGRQSRQLNERFMDEMREGVVRGEGLGDLTRRIRGTRENAFADGIMATSTKHAQTLARTSVQTVSNQARNQVYLSNQDVIGGIYWIATLDNRTTIICIGLDGSVWTLPDFTPVGDAPDYPGPTAHWNCRSTQGPAVKSWEQLAEENGGNTKIGRQIRELPPSTRQSMDGQVPSTMKYEDWLKSKSPAFQKEVLGSAKWGLWDQGKLTFRDLISEQARPLTVRQLAEKTISVSAPATEWRIKASTWETVDTAEAGIKQLQSKYGIETVSTEKFGSAFHQRTLVPKRLNIIGEEMARMFRDNPRLAEEWFNALQAGHAAQPIRDLIVWNTRDLSVKSPLQSGWAGSMDPLFGQMNIAAKRELMIDTIHNKAIGEWSIGEASLPSIFRHETGHAVHLRVFNEASDAGKTWDRLFEKLNKNDWFQKNVSKYAGANQREAFSEAFALYTHPNYARGELPGELEKYFDKWVKGN